MKNLLFCFFLIACNQDLPTSDAGGGVLPDLPNRQDLTAPAGECHRCLLDMRCTEGCNALGVCGTPSTSCQ